MSSALGLSELTVGAGGEFGGVVDEAAPSSPPQLASKHRIANIGTPFDLEIIDREDTRDADKGMSSKYFTWPGKFLLRLQLKRNLLTE
jgi:hypothetical protein